MKRPHPVAGFDVVHQQALPFEGNARPIVRPQGAPQRSAQVTGRVHGLAVKVDETKPGQAEDTQRRLGQRLGQAAAEGEQRGDRQLPDQVNQGQLARQPRREKIQGREPVKLARLYHGAQRAEHAHHRHKKIDPSPTHVAFRPP
jgi:hypothetical protein